MSKDPNAVFRSEVGYGELERLSAVETLKGVEGAASAWYDQAETLVRHDNPRAAFIFDAHAFSLTRLVWNFIKFDAIITKCLTAESAESAEIN